MKELDNVNSFQFNDPNDPIKNGLHYYFSKQARNLRGISFLKGILEDYFPQDKSIKLITQKLKSIKPILNDLKNSQFTSINLMNVLQISVAEYITQEVNSTISKKTKELIDQWTSENDKQLFETPDVNNTTQNLNPFLLFTRLSEEITKLKLEDQYKLTESELIALGLSCFNKIIGEPEQNNRYTTQLAIPNTEPTNALPINQDNKIATNQTQNNQVTSLNTNNLFSKTNQPSTIIDNNHEVKLRIKTPEKLLNNPNTLISGSTSAEKKRKIDKISKIEDLTKTEENEISEPTLKKPKIQEEGLIKLQTNEQNTSLLSEEIEKMEPFRFQEMRRIADGFIAYDAPRPNINSPRR